MWKALMEVWYRVWGQKRENGCGCGDFENVDTPSPQKKTRKRKKKMTGVCSAHKYGEDPKCPTCYPETVFIAKEKPKRKARAKKVK